MPLTAGVALAQYRITAALGAGGMGEVWSATNTRLVRDVALKLLPPALASDPERLARFEREARVLVLRVTSPMIRKARVPSRS